MSANVNTRRNAWDQGFHVVTDAQASRGFKNTRMIDVKLIIWPVLTLFYTRGLGIVVLHVMVPKPYRFPLCFLK
jgi:hypothetical protein